MTVRQVQTSAHGPMVHICGIQPEPSEERVALRRNYHPGFGGVSLRNCKPRRKDKVVWSAARPQDSRTLGWIERTHVTEEEGVTWRLRVDGPMVSYTLVRRRPKFWVLESSEDGFA